MSWRPLDIFKSEKETSSQIELMSGNENVQANENTVRSLFINSYVAKTFSEKIIIKVIVPAEQVENKMKK